LLQEKLIEPHEKQQTILRTTKRRMILKCGRRSGKTWSLAYLALIRALEGRSVLYGSPTALQSDAFWGYLTEWLAADIATGSVRESKSSRKLIFPGQGRIHCRTAWDIDTWRGAGGDVILVDEYDYMREDPLPRVIFPMLAEGGELWLASTPNGRRFINRRMLQAKNAPDRWDILQMSTMDNPHLDESAIEELAADMTSEDVQQELHGEIIAHEGAVFAPTDEDFWEPHGTCEHDKVMAIDWGSSPDHSAVSLMCHHCHREYAIKRTSGRYIDQREDIIGMWKAWGQPRVIAEENSVGKPNIEDMQAAGVPVDPFVTTNESKRQIVRTMKLALERHELLLVEDEIARLELENFEAGVTPTGMPTFAAPKGEHDDTVMARCIAWFAPDPFPFVVVGGHQ